MNTNLMPAGGLALTQHSSVLKVTGEVGFIVPTLLKPVSVSAQIISDSEFTILGIQVKKYEIEWVLIPPPSPFGVDPIGRNKGSKLEPQGTWTVVRKVDGSGPIEAYAGEAVIIEVAFASSLIEPDVDQANLEVVAEPLTFAPYPLTGTKPFIG